MKCSFFIPGAILLMIAGCSKSPDTPAAMIPERIEMTTGSQSITIGGMVTLNIAYYNTLGVVAATPAGIMWTSSNMAIATVNQQGIVTGASAGQAEIKATYNNARATALVTVVANNSQTAIVEISPGIKELVLNEAFTPAATAKDINGNVLAGKTFTWKTDNALYAGINSSTGQVNAMGYGTANITATTDGIQSSPAMIQVIRTGNFMTMGSTGAAKLKIENAVLKLQTTSNFSVASAPDLRIYLGNNNNNINGAIEIATLTMRSGMQSWNIPGTVTITQYRYVIVWCKQFGGVYGVADLGN